jgi:hypothetical protein
MRRSSFMSSIAIMINLAQISIAGINLESPNSVEVINESAISTGWH